jgi:hypothetical protein
LFLGVISGNINPPGGYRRRDPRFWKPEFIQKSVFEKFEVDFLNVFLKPVAKIIGRGHAFFEAVLMGMVLELIDWRSGEIFDFFCIPHPPTPKRDIEKITRQLMCFRFCKTRSRETRGESIP